MAIKKQLTLPYATQLMAFYAQEAVSLYAELFQFMQSFSSE